MNYNAVVDSSLRIYFSRDIIFGSCGRIGYDTTLSRCVIAGSSPVRTAFGSLIFLKSALDDYTEVPSVSFYARVGSKHFRMF